MLNNGKFIKNLINLKKLIESRLKPGEKHYGICGYCGNLCIWKETESKRCTKCSTPPDNIKEVCIEQVWAEQKTKIEEMIAELIAKNERQE